MEFVIALITLVFLEIVLGVDNIIFVSIVTNHLPEKERNRARVLGLSLALIFRVLLLITIAWMIHHLVAPFFPIDGMTREEVLLKLEQEKDFFKSVYYIWHSIGVRELVLAVGGLFLLGKSVSEIHHKMEVKSESHAPIKKQSAFRTIMLIIALDIVFSFDSILTAVGITEDIYAMVVAVVIAMIVMMVFARRIADYIAGHPTLEMLALSFLILIGFMLVLEGVHIDVPKGYIYFAVFFSLIMEVMNMKLRKVIEIKEVSKDTYDKNAD
jgi:predicted tellurium resistance membrane protein TerC